MVDLEAIAFAGSIAPTNFNSGNGCRCTSPTSTSHNKAGRFSDGVNSSKAGRLSNGVNSGKANPDLVDPGAGDT